MSVIKGDSSILCFEFHGAEGSLITFNLWIINVCRDGNETIPLMHLMSLKEAMCFSLEIWRIWPKISPFSQLWNHPGKCLIAEWLLMMKGNLPTFICLFPCAAELHPPFTVLESIWRPFAPALIWAREEDDTVAVWSLQQTHPGCEH